MYVRLYTSTKITSAKDFTFGPVLLTTKKTACHSNKAESTTHVFLHCTYFANQKLSLLNKIEGIDKLIFEKKDSFITQTLLFGDFKCFLTVNKSVSQTIIQFIWCLQKWHNEPFLMISWMISSAPEEVHPEMVIYFVKLTILSDAILHLYYQLIVDLPTICCCPMSLKSHFFSF